MIRLFFCAANLALTGFFLYMGVKAYLNWDGTWDAGVIPLFLAGWFAFAAFGFWLSNIWLISMASLTLVATSLLTMFIVALGELQKNFGISKTGSDTVLWGLGLIGFIVSGEVYAFWRHRRRTGADRQHAPPGQNGI